MLIESCVKWEQTEVDGIFTFAMILLYFYCCRMGHLIDRNAALVTAIANTGRSHKAKHQY